MFVDNGWMKDKSVLVQIMGSINSIMFVYNGWMKDKSVLVQIMGWG